MRQVADAGVYTIGYEGRGAEDFVEDLVDSCVQVLVDVRELPISRKPGFSKSALSSLVEKVGIEYLHFRSLGSPRAARKKLKAGGDFEEFVKDYDAHLELNPNEIHKLAHLLLSGRRAALMCFERDHTRCHRSLLLGALFEAAGQEFEVYHL